ncbi:MAG TPA: glutathione S-transferase N-terminal domain-containing protein, partial [Candidatus Binatia bacterium]|nr:glutathione S-transferase N-terminal domain-containing protein [Candidatus Binatia bacterium]
MLKLYGVPRSRAMRSLWMLEELGLPYENVKVDFITGTKASGFKELNPNGHIPVLQDGDLVLWESLAINLYLARKYDKGLWPKTVEDEGRAYQWSLWAMTEAEEPLLTALLNRV